MYLMKELIRKKRDKHLLTQNEIQFFVDSVVDNSASNEQISAMAMAIFLNDLSNEERKNLTLSMRDSGDVIKFDNLVDKPIVDKHSTGGVGDLVSIVLAPIVAFCGGYVPMISGKGLGHTGGTTDKMQAIPNYNVFPSVEKFKEVVQNVGCAIIGQTSNLAPADRKIYTIRDTTGSVESIPLIASSILSKKLASGINYLVMDIKCGSGAFMSNLADATSLGQCIVDIAKSCNVDTKVVISDMNESLSKNIGNSLEIKESIDFLLNKNIDSKLKEITYALAVEMLLISNITNSEAVAYQMVEKSITSGGAAEVFEKMVCALGGDCNILKNYEKILPKAKIKKDIYLKNSGFISNINNRELGLTLVSLGGGRKVASDILDLSVGLENVLKIGSKIDSSTPFATIHCNDESHIAQIEDTLNKIIEVSPSIESCKKINNIYAKI